MTLTASPLSPGTKVSVGSARSNAVQDADIATLLADIKGGKWRDQIEHIRSVYRQAEAEGRDPGKAVAILKKALPAILCSGIFSERAGAALINHSGIICADLDHLGDQLEQARTKLNNSPHVFASFRSPTGSGLKVLFRVRADASSHLASFQAVQAHVRAVAGVEIDEACKDVARLCFVSYDPETMINLGAEELPPLAELEPRPTPLVISSPGAPGTRKDIAERILGPVLWESDDKGFCPCPGQHLHTAPNGQRDCQVFIDGAPTITCFHSSCRGIVDAVNHSLRFRIGKAEVDIRAAMPSAPDALDPARETDSSAAPKLVVLPSGSVTISEAAREIFRRLAPLRTIFERRGVMVELTEVDGIRSLEVLRPESFRSRAEKVGPLYVWRISKTGSPSLVPANMTRDTAAALTATYEAREILPSVSSVLRCPAIIESQPGVVAVLGKGYHSEQGGLLILNGELPPLVPVDEAVASLKWLIEEFDFLSEGDRSRALAAFITPALRIGGHIKGNCPIDAAEADLSQSGKGYRHELVCTTYNELAYIVTARTGGVGSVEESFAAALVAGRPFICLDNLRGRLDSQHLESFLTAPGLFPARVPGCSEVLVKPKRFLIQLSSNGFESTRDLMNRASVCRIRKRPGFAYRDTLGELQSRQPYFLGCVFAVVAEWVASGKPKTKDRRHDFAEWCQALDWICQNILGAAPLMDGHEEAQERAANPALSWLRGVALAMERERKLGVAVIASEVAEICGLPDVDIPGLKDTDENKAKQQVGTLMRRGFGGTTPAAVDGFEVVKGARSQSRIEGGAVELKTYTFRKL
jgi:hypothetical protein